MLTLKRCLFCIRLETGCMLISVYCSLTDVVYIAALVQLYRFVRVTKHDRDMFFVDKLKALGISACVNLMIYHTIASLLLSIGVRKRKHQAIRYYFKFHFAIFVFTTLFGLVYLYIFPEILLMSSFLFDTVTRFYSLVITNSLYHQLRSEDKENELVNMRELSRMSYGAVDDIKSTPSHHVTFTLDSSRLSLDSDDLDEGKDDPEWMP